MYGNKYVVVLNFFSQLSILTIANKWCSSNLHKVGKKIQKNYNVGYGIEINHLFHDKLTQVFHNNKMSLKFFLKESQS
jgi:hypothetical protein